MKKVTLKDLNGKIIESYFASNHPDNFPTNMENHTVEDVPSNKDWFEMSGGQYDDPDHPLNKHDEGQTYWTTDCNEQDVNENSAGEGAHEGWKKGYKDEGKGEVWSSLTQALFNKIKLQESGSQIKVNIDDTIPSDFLDTADLHLGSIYVAAGLGLTAKFVAPALLANKTLLQMKRHGTLFYVEEGQLLKATEQEVDNYLNEPF